MKKNRKIICFAIILCVVIVGAAAVYWYMCRSTVIAVNGKAQKNGDVLIKDIVLKGGTKHGAWQKGPTKGIDEGGEYYYQLIECSAFTEDSDITVEYDAVSVGFLEEYELSYYQDDGKLYIILNMDDNFGVLKKNIKIEKITVRNASAEEKDGAFKD